MAATLPPLPIAKRSKDIESVQSEGELEAEVEVKLDQERKDRGGSGSRSRTRSQLTSGSLASGRLSSPSAVLAEVGRVQVEQSVPLTSDGIPSISVTGSPSVSVSSHLTLLKRVLLRSAMTNVNVGHR